MGDNPGGNTTTIRVRIEREIQLSFTPLMVPTVAQFLQDSSLNVSLLYNFDLLFLTFLVATEPGVVFRYYA